MTMLNSTDGATGILPTEYADLIVGPVTAEAVPFRTEVATTIRTASHEVRVPILREDAGAAWVREGEEIDPDDPTLDELTIAPAKVAGLTIISRELAEDSSPEAAELVGQSLARSIVAQVNAAFLTGLPAPAPAGLPAATATQITVSGVDEAERANAYVYTLRNAVSQVRAHGGTPSAVLMNPADAFAMSAVTEAEGSRRFLMESAETVEGLPVIQSAAVPVGRAWVVDHTQVLTVLREGTTVAVSSDAYFSSDRVAVRATMRVGFGFPAPARLAVIALDGEPIAA